MLSCKKVALDMTESLDQELSLSKRIRLAVHLTICRECLHMKGQLLLLKEATHQAGNSEVALPINDDVPAMSSDFQERLNEAVENFEDDSDEG